MDKSNITRDHKFRSDIYAGIVHELDIPIVNKPLKLVYSHTYTGFKLLILKKLPYIICLPSIKA